MNTTNQKSFSARAAAFSLNLSRKVLACSLAYLMIPLGMGDLYAQTAPPPPPPDQQQYQGQAPLPPDQQYPDQYDEDQGPPPQSYDVLSPDQLNELVAPIALYPDSLVAQILAASTYPDEVADADHFVEANQQVPPDELGQMVNGMDWDPSVKALVAFPSVLSNLDRNLEWTIQLGNAYYNQPQDVMSAVQEMRQRAYDAGNLRSTSQLAVEYSPDNIVIAPANPAVVYVPWYDPWTVYGAPISPWSGYYVRPRPAGLYFTAGLGIGFGIGVAVGHWNRWGWGWHHWGMGWHSHSIVYNRNIYISRSPHVRNHGYYGRFDRNQAARHYNRGLAVRAHNTHRVYGRGTNRRDNQPAIAPFYNRNQPRNQYRTDNNRNRPNSNVRRSPNFSRPNNNARPNQPNNRPDTNNRIAPFNRNNSRPDSNLRPAPNASRPENRPQPRPNTSRPDNHPRPTPNSNVRRAPNVNRSNPNARPNNAPRIQPFYNRPNNNARPQPRVERPQPRPQARPQARPQPRPQARPQPRQQSHENHGRSSGNNPGRGHDKNGH